METACQSPFDLSFSALVPDEQLSVCNRWLENNPDHEMRHLAVLLKEQATTIKDQATTIKDQVNTIKEWSLASVTDTYPKLTDRTLSGFYWPENHEPAAVVSEIIESKLFDEVESLCMSGEFWNVPYERPLTEDCDSESEVVKMVSSLLASVIKGLKLQNVVDVVHNRTLAGAECDILLLYTPNRLPFATLEIKKPPTKEEERTRLFHGDKSGNKVAEEIFAEMKGVQLFGFPKVYGMVSTHNQFRLVCTDQINEASDNIGVMEAAWKKLKAEVANDTDSGDSKDSLNPKKVVFDKRKNALETQIHGSQIVPDLDGNPSAKAENEGSEIMKLLTLFVLKACTTLTQLLDGGYQPGAINILGTMPCRVLTRDQNQFAFSTVQLERLNLQHYIPKLANIHVVHHLGMGGSGNCCLGVSQNGGSSCAVKFYHEAGKEQSIYLASKEYENWENIYGHCRYGPPMSRQLKLVEGYCLVMPYLRPIPKDVRHELLQNGKIKATLVAFAELGYKHLDIKWRHFGLWKGECYLLDLEKVDTLHTKDMDSWVDEEMEKLYKRAGNSGSDSDKRTPSHTKQRTTLKKARRST